MLHYRTALCTLVIFGILAAPLHADVIGSASKKNASTPKAPPVQERFDSVGLARASALTPGELAYFGDAPERVQIVGETDNLWYETAIGGAFLVGSAIFIAGIITHNKD